ncbi:hypothetical protein [Acidipila sp. EB88]|uniref:hypothetical protein n=1 Tax=Acidipila sp. EB88 TaxID=2305226 RepID=UPI000F60391F|nr:hypothetical protein [Acidipila sp. EB88]RRA48812.1 hypothetical protein D1Y84_11470 [Acidipila sp. EB88]
MHFLPLWFLVLSLFLPRVALFLGWMSHWRFPVAPAPVGDLLSPVLWLVLPRLLVLIMIFFSQGISLWFVLHLLAAFGVFGFGTHRTVYRDRYRDR